jgi:uncharacterized protein YabN with tetrapyrrole methylase and pyrophosphatase domain
MSNHEALERLIAIEQDARDFGFDWPDIDMIIAQAVSECEEIAEAIKHHEPSIRVQEEIGDLLHTAISLCLFAGFDVTETLHKVTEKFSARMNGMKHLTQQRGLKNLRGKDIKFMLELWREVKQQELIKG